ncbi:FAD-dependent oxidoreductase [Allopusillimonas ginsengisoli]|uniref:FAD-dependent oxidoreductase n=1 Tax=Allopusillimonas ginsengisoli TaxID=453575 RepID=UPI0010C21F2D|nr:FAD-dependent oxidoreductase [Allopusillimonas ginsengisoli]
MNPSPIVIVGTGLAGYAVARELRRLDEQAEIAMFTLDEGHFYSKPMLSNGISAGKDAVQLRAQAVDRMREQLKAQVYAGSAIQAIDPACHQIMVAGQPVSYSKLVLALGAEPLRIPLQGNAADRVVSINTLDDYSALFSKLDGPKRITILGAGLIGCEFANDLARAGHTVSLVDPGPCPLSRLLPLQIGMLMRDALTGIGVKVYCDTVCVAVNDAEGPLQLDLSGGIVEYADIVISAIGLRPRTALAEQAGIAVDRGIIVNRHLETSAADVYALGDCAQVSGTLLPYVMPIMQCAKALALTLSGQRVPVNYAAMPIVVKTPAFPIAISPPMIADGDWVIETMTETSIKATYFNAANEATGFIVGRAHVNEHRKLAQSVPPWLEPMLG